MRILSLFLLILFLCPISAQSQTTSAFEITECQIQLDVPLRCGSILVPEDYTQPTGRMIKLPITIISSQSPNPTPDPVVYLTGGPGDSARPLAAAWSRHPLRQQRDIIIIEQRGTSLTEPALNCPEVGAAVAHMFISADTYLQAQAREIQATQACAERFITQGIKLSAYNSATIAADLKEIRITLGYEQWNMYGVSYGTRLAQAAVMVDPSGIRSMVLDSPLPLTHGRSDRITHIVHSLEALFITCATDSKCATAYPNLQQRFETFLNTLDQEPLELTLRYPGMPQEQTIFLQRHDLVAIIANALYQTNLRSYLPLLLDQIINRETAQLRPLLEQGLPTSTGDGEGMYYAVVCNDERLLYNQAEFNAAIQSNSLYEALVPTTMIEICVTWAAEPTMLSITPQNTPTLIMAGQYDPVTPISNGYRIATNFPNSLVLEIPATAHALWLAGNPCPRELAATFVETLDLTLDTACLTHQHVQPNLTPDAIYLTPALYRLRMNTYLNTFILAGVYLLLCCYAVLRLLRQKNRTQTGILIGIAATSMLTGIMSLLVIAYNTPPLMLAFGLPTFARYLVLFPILALILTLLVSIKALRDTATSASERILSTSVCLTTIVFTFWLWNLGMFYSIL